MAEYKGSGDEPQSTARTVLITGRIFAIYLLRFLAGVGCGKMP
jgi:hypothetical protein